MSFRLFRLRLRSHGCVQWRIRITSSFRERCNLLMYDNKLTRRERKIEIPGKRTAIYPRSERAVITKKKIEKNNRKIEKKKRRRKKEAPTATLTFPRSTMLLQSSHGTAQKTNFRTKVFLNSARELSDVRDEIFPLASS